MKRKSRFIIDIKWALFGGLIMLIVFIVMGSVFWSALAQAQGLADEWRRTSFQQLQMTRWVWNSCAHLADGHLDEESKPCNWILTGALTAPIYCMPEEYKGSVSATIEAAQRVLKHWKQPGKLDSNFRWQEPLHDALEREYGCLNARRE